MKVFNLLSFAIAPFIMVMGVDWLNTFYTMCNISNGIYCHRTRKNLNCFNEFENRGKVEREQIATTTTNAKIILSGVRMSEMNRLEIESMHLQLCMCVQNDIEKWRRPTHAGKFKENQWHLTLSVLLHIIRMRFDSSSSNNSTTRSIRVTRYIHFIGQTIHSQRMKCFIHAFDESCISKRFFFCT